MGKFRDASPGNSGMQGPKIPGLTLIDGNILLKKNTFLKMILRAAAPRPSFVPFGQTA
jgi:hypothetical protein